MEKLRLARYRYMHKGTKSDLDFNPGTRIHSPYYTRDRRHINFSAPQFWLVVIIPISEVIMGIKLSMALKEDALGTQRSDWEIGYLLSNPPSYALHAPFRDNVIL